MIFGERNFQMNTTVFHYGLTPYELAVYSYAGMPVRRGSGL